MSSKFKDISCHPPLHYYMSLLQAEITGGLIRVIRIEMGMHSNSEYACSAWDALYDTTP
jgi:hypothetical protein